MGCRYHFALVALAAALTTGCVERRFRVESNPPGAYVYVNNVPHGPTPVDIPFIYYGDYDITLVKEGYQTLKVAHPTPPPWYQYPIIDFFAESIWPGQLTDIRPVYYELEPAVQPNLDLLKAEAEELRKRGKGMPEPRYPEKKDDATPAGRPGRKDAPEQLPVPKDAVPPPREVPGLPQPRPDAPDQE